ncbi:MAG: hypothetical protein K6B52_04010 [Clostridiales bacterium]|nr:hypothetical protein [Clostridiales bacterium]
MASSALQVVDFGFDDNLALSNAVRQPLYVPEEKKRTALRQRRRPKLRLKSEVKRIAAISVAATAVLLMAAALINVRIQIVETQNNIAVIERKISTLESENTKLEAELNAVFSADKVEKYATEVLGMQKIERNQIHYFEKNTGDAVTVCNGKEVSK